MIQGVSYSRGNAALNPPNYLKKKKSRYFFQAKKEEIQRPILFKLPQEMHKGTHRHL